MCKKIDIKETFNSDKDQEKEHKKQAMANILVNFVMVLKTVKESSNIKMVILMKANGKRIASAEKVLILKLFGLIINNYKINMLEAF